MEDFDTVLLDLDHRDRVATVTLNRPEALNSFNRRMCEEMRQVWHLIKDDEAINAVVLRAAGERAFSAGL
ncbi:MAG: enoyl-CoA hydratase/isomerase family protein, partial [Mycobacterium sp.]|nr:enoyl-CoA hydratase/isomerase family protein [Mycobacterium sp.]